MFAYISKISHINAKNVAEAFPKWRHLLVTFGYILAKSVRKNMFVQFAVKVTMIRIHYRYIQERTLEKSPGYARNVGKHLLIHGC